MNHGHNGRNPQLSKIVAHVHGECWGSLRHFEKEKITCLQIQFKNLGVCGKFFQQFFYGHFFSGAGAGGGGATGQALFASSLSQKSTFWMSKATESGQLFSFFTLFASSLSAVMALAKFCCACCMATCCKVAVSCRFLSLSDWISVGVYLTMESAQRTEENSTRKKIFFIEFRPCRSGF